MITKMYITFIAKNWIDNPSYNVKLNVLTEAQEGEDKDEDDPSHAYEDVRGMENRPPIDGSQS